MKILSKQQRIKSTLLIALIITKLVYENRALVDEITQLFVVNMALIKLLKSNYVRQCS